MIDSIQEQAQPLQELAGWLRELAELLRRAYGHLPTDRFPGPPDTICEQLRLRADAVEAASRPAMTWPNPMSEAQLAGLQNEGRKFSERSGHERIGEGAEAFVAGYRRALQHEAFAVPAPVPTQQEDAEALLAHMKERIAKHGQNDTVAWHYVHGYDNGRAAAPAAPVLEEWGALAFLVRVPMEPDKGMWAGYTTDFYRSREEIPSHDLPPVGEITPLFARASLRTAAPAEEPKEDAIRAARNSAFERAAEMCEQRAVSGARGASGEAAARQCAIDILSQRDTSLRTSTAAPSAEPMQRYHRNRATR